VPVGGSAQATSARAIRGRQRMETSEQAGWAGLL
jgi:hypothetical protein